jgi:hypothetical protein
LGSKDGIWGYFPVFPSTSRFFSNQCDHIIIIFLKDPKIRRSANAETPSSIKVESDWPGSTDDFFYCSTIGNPKNISSIPLFYTYSKVNYYCEAVGAASISCSGWDSSFTVSISGSVLPTQFITDFSASVNSWEIL